MTVFSPFCAPRRWRALPRPNLITSPGANAILEGRDCLGGSRPDESCLGGRRFVTDGQNNAFLSTFGGIMLAPLGSVPHARVHVQVVRRWSSNRFEES
jgi:hypothetical protein